MRRKKLPSEPIEATIESLSHEGRGITHINGKIVFVDEALPGETVRFLYTRRRSKFDEGTAVEIINPSPHRVSPGCEYFSLCGGCSLQHMDSAFQIQHKQAVLLEQLQHIGGVDPETVLPPLVGPVWGYRHKARLGVKYVHKKEKVLVGFREKRKPYVADIDRCEVLHPSVGDKILELKQLIDSLAAREQIPQLEVAVADNDVVLVIRHLMALDSSDRDILAAYERKHDLRFFLQGGDEDTIQPLTEGKAGPLSYAIDNDSIIMDFGPLDFTQINFRINREMIKQVIGLLAPEKDDKVLDLFCGLGNFTLPLARRSGFVLGVEGAAALVDKAVGNAQKNGIENVDFCVANLYAENIDAGFMREDYDKVLLDPPRSGAREIIEQMQLKHVKRLVYVSCNPATLARDAGILVKEKGYTLSAAGVMDMFPHTTHVESIALFDKS